MDENRTSVDVWGYVCVYRTLHSLAIPDVTVLWGFDVGGKDALRKRERMQVWDTKLEALSCAPEQKTLR